MHTQTPTPPPTHTQQITNYGKTYKCTVVHLKTSTMLQYINNLWFLESPLRGPKYNMIHVKLTKNLKGLSERGPTVCNFLGRFCFLSRHFSRAFCEGNKAYSWRRILGVLHVTTNMIFRISAGKIVENKNQPQKSQRPFN